MDFNHKVAIFVLIFIVIFAFTFSFSNFEDVKQKIFNSSKHMSHGSVDKIKENDGIRYFLQFNLPRTETPLQTSDLDKPFNDTGDLKLEYSVYMGKDLESMKYIDALKREVTGFYVLEHKSEEDYKKVCVLLNDTQVSCLDI